MEQDQVIGDSERWASALLGGMLVLSSLRRRDVGSGAVFALGGAALLHRGLTGHDGFFRAVAGLVGGAAGVEDPWEEHDEVEEASMESFPASDSPSWTPVTGSNGED